MIIKFIKDENGQGMLEYVLIIALVALVVIGAIIVVNRTAGKASNKSNEAMSKANEALGESGGGAANIPGEDD